MGPLVVAAGPPQPDSRARLMAPAITAPKVRFMVFPSSRVNGVGTRTDPGTPGPVGRWVTGRACTRAW